MEKLGAMDANFLYTETDQVLNHIASIQKIRLPEGTNVDDFVANLKKLLLSRVHLVPYMTRKLRWVPGNIDHPFWVKDESFSIDNHVEVIPLPAPGTHRQFEEKIAEIHGIPMDRTRPLWSLKVLTGFEDGSVAYYNQVHHACLDGVSGQNAIVAIMDLTPEPRTEEPPAGYFDKENTTVADMVSLSVENLFRFQLNAASRFFGGIESSTRLAQRYLNPALPMGSFTEAAPRTRFNHNIIRARSYAAGECSLNDIKAIGKAMDAKVNDVFMAVVAGGLRRYLERDGDLPARGLIAGCPVSLRQPGDTRQGNQVTMMKVNLGTEIANPKVRLQAIKDSANAAKSVTADLAPGFDAEVSVPGLPAMITAAAKAAEQTQAAEYATPAVNLVISNVPGPREQLYSLGGEMMTHYPVSIPAHGVGLNITVQSYKDKLFFAITACAKALPDAHLLRDDMDAAFHELKSLFVQGNVASLKPRVEDKAPAKAVEKAANAEEQVELKKIA